MNDLESHGLLEIPVFCYVKPQPRLLNSFLGRCLSLLLLQLHGAAGCACIYRGHIPHTYCRSGTLTGPEEEVGTVTRAWKLPGKTLPWLTAG